ncbi:MULTISPECIES: winged helix-turn-helix transcriptional regulator [Tsukamurella]|uniref:Helix-turn-helix transcriptional regulator n=2 Tax=Tsukamurella TaxID=2060 RepID=A0A5C5RWP8_9ACTN|nr:MULTISPECIES: helix-turn-helix domain-containing protein [Tsukamurella]NMD55639.1 helix-turn-helix transcriptional regulator [Tsukamurella columbiensis]TWS26948.1 helix-turn-helix transcriptional regulator [Tsukamurella conjunctivitidis]
MEFEERLRDRSRWAIGDGCSAARTLDLLTTKTVFLVLRELLYGTTRFDDLVARTETSAPAVSRALKQLASADLIMATEYREPGARARAEYRLTPAGEDLLPVFLALIQFGDAHLQPEGAPLVFVDAETGESVRTRPAAGGAEVPLSGIEVRLNRERWSAPERISRAGSADPSAGT